MKTRPHAATRALPPHPRLNQLNDIVRRNADQPHRVVYARPYRTGWPGIAGAWLVTRQAPLTGDRRAGRRAIRGSRRRITRILQRAWDEVQRAARRSGRLPPCQSLDELRGLIAAAPRAELRIGQLAATQALRRFVRSLSAPA